MGSKLGWCKLRQSINNFNQLLNIITKITKTKYQSHTNTRIYVKKPFLLKGKKPQEILQIKFTIVKSIIKFEIYQPYVCLTAKENSHCFFSLTHYFSSWLHLPQNLIHYYAYCEFSLFFALLCNINKVSQIFIDLCALQNLLSTTLKFCCLFPCITSQAKISFQGIALFSTPRQPKNNQFNFPFFN